MSNNQVIPLFPLGLVLLPGTALPLHIFEDRYKTMIRSCSRDHAEFGIVYYNGSLLRRFGCTARTVGVVHTYEDGRMDILNSGNRRFEIIRLIEGEPFLQAEIRFFEDTPEDQVHLNELAMSAIDHIEDLANLAGKKFERAALHRMSPQTLSFVLANTDLLNLEERQEVLEGTSCGKRLQTVVLSAQRSMERLNSTKQLQQLLGVGNDISHMFN